MANERIKTLQQGKGVLPQGKVPNSSIESLKNANLFERGVVIDTIGDVSLRDSPPDSLDEAAKKWFNLAPRNSIICRLLTTDNNLSTKSDVICFPFFSSHFVLPIKPGEQVWIFRPKNFSDNKSNVFYWLSRFSGVLPVEDVNFTPFSRQIDVVLTGTVEPSRVLQVPNILYGGALGGIVVAGDNSALMSFTQNSVEKGQFKLEPVPRMTKRPGDFLLQGSNNTTITLGTDRGWGFVNRPNTSDSPKSNASPKDDSPLQDKSGAIDIVVGRCRYFDTDENKIKAERKSVVKNSTQPLIAKNSFEKFETDKDPQQAEQLVDDKDGVKVPDPGNLKTNPAEGDPDFLIDASRIYIAENTKIDEKLGMGKGADLDGVIPKGFAADFAPQVGAAIAVKSDHIRIIARKTKIEKHSEKEPGDPNFPDVNGSIRIVKEGNSRETLASIIIEPDGTIQISGSKIFLGRTPDDGGAGKGPGDGESQPYVKYKDLEDIWKDFMKEMSTFCDNMTAAPTPGYGAPSPKIDAAVAALKAAISAKHEKAIEKVQSKRIFGE